MWVDFSREAVDILFFYDECSRLNWKRKLLLRYVVCFYFCNKRRTFILQFNRVVHFNGDSCSKQMVHSNVRLPRSYSILSEEVYIWKKISVTEKRATVPTAEVSLCVHSVNTISVWWCSYWRFCFVLFCLFQVPAHILCLSVASGWNKERCISEI
jgi:hypothetical protein